MPDKDAELRRQLLALLNGGQAHADFETAVKDFPAALRGKVPQELPYSGWQLVEHMRITQRDILEFSSPPEGGYRELDWPKDYWPRNVEPPSDVAWEESLAAVRRDRAAFEALIQRPETDLYWPFDWGNGQNLLREALLIADHGAYHLGELVLLRRLLGIWKK